LSGGGFRAMLFHVGSLWRLNEAGLLPRLKRVSSVSGGSITAGLLGLKWKRLGFAGDGVAQAFGAELVEPIRRLASRTIDEGAVLGGVLLPGSVADRVERAYRRHLFGDATLQDLPADDEGPRFVMNASNVQSGVLWRFSRPFMGDWKVGLVRSPTIPLALAVAASSAFPPVLSPVVLDLDPDDFDPGTGDGLTAREFRDEVVLTDGGVYDNLGLETAWKRYRTILVSDAGGRFGADPDPSRDWLRHTQRILSIIDSQVRSLRKRQVIGAFREGIRSGAYWSIWTDAAEYGLADALPCPVDRTTLLAEVPTRLARLDDTVQERLINWGYAVCDCALRARHDTTLRRGSFPYPASGIG
ncbi:MAG TPA: patatin-like phospholipase family protein, partial [Longimicrobiaceae bacterium]|nr:patatin-like phospholipase family protein [Longimicrobiaceae bacterium]